jgi:hypothetical protein
LAAGTSAFFIARSTEGTRLDLVQIVSPSTAEPATY